MQFFRALYLFSIGLLFMSSLYFLPSLFQPSAEKVGATVQKTTHELLKQAEIDLNNLSFAVEQGAYFNPEFEFLKKEKSFLVFAKDSLIFWTDDQSTFDLSELKSKKRIIASSNAIYLKTELRKNNKDYYCLNLLQYKHPLNNKFLSNKLARKFNLTSILNINLKRGEVPIYAANGPPLFYIQIDESQHSTVVIVFFIALFFIACYFLFYLFPTELKSRNSLFIIVTAVAVRIWFFNFLPPIFKNLALLDSNQFTLNNIAPTLGDLFLHLLLVFMVLYQVKKIFIRSKSKLISLLFAFLSIAFSFSTIFIITESVALSDINFDFSNLFELNLLSLIAFISFSILILSNFLLFHILFTVSTRAWNTKYVLFVAAYATVSLIVFAFIAEGNLLFYYPLGLIPFFAIRPQKTKQTKTIVVLLLLIFSSAIVAYSISIAAENRESHEQKEIIKKLSEERDIVAENLFKSIFPALSADTFLINSISNYWEKKEEIDEYLTKEYFNSYWDKYQITFVICAEEDEIIISNQANNCWNYFNRTLRAEGRSIGSKNLFQLNNFAGRIDYLGKIPLYTDSTRRELFIEFSSIYLNENEGYPELLVDDQAKSSSISLENYSFAVYNKKSLVYKTGAYNYSTVLKISELTSKSYYQYRTKNDQHLAFQKDKDVTIILSRRLFSFYDFLTSLAYILVIVSICFLVAILSLHRFPFYLSLNIHDFSTKIQLFLIGSILTSLLLLAFGTAYYIKVQYKAKNENTLQEKIRSVNLELEGKVGSEEFLADELQDYVQAYLVKFSNVFYSDINLYRLNGSLYASSRTELFDKGIKSERMNPQALFALANDNKAQWVQEEFIGDLHYLSAYIPFKNYDNEVIGYLNLPYFAKQGALEKEISTFLISTLNIYVGIFALALLISVLLINQLSKPLLLIRQQISKLKLGSSIELINWNSKDEIGALVQEYNRIAIELNESAEELAKNEREVAWREMAKQVAHEIKNPLTPMKLSIQHLQRAVAANSDNLNERIERTAKTLIEQIETLSNIASAFSSFAKLPAKSLQKIDLIPILKNAIDLYSHSISIQLNFSEKLPTAIVLGDKDQLLRVFNNLIKNAVQATESNSKIEIAATISYINNFYIVEIKDNGVGIPPSQAERIFEPNFTTKSSGTGLGLAMSKNIINQMNGSISFHSVENVGTTFKIELPEA